MKQNRLKSRVVWLSVIAQIILIMSIYVSPDLTEEVKVILTALVEIFTIFGILNNPTEKEKF